MSSPETAPQELVAAINIAVGDKLADLERDINSPNTDAYLRAAFVENPLAVTELATRERTFPSTLRRGYPSLADQLDSKVSITQRVGVLEESQSLAQLWFGVMGTATKNLKNREFLELPMNEHLSNVLRSL